VKPVVNTKKPTTRSFFLRAELLPLDDQFSYIAHLDVQLGTEWSSIGNEIFRWTLKL
jgi:hypothetical protein